MVHEDLTRVGARLRDLRRQRGWTLDELSGRAGMSASTLSRLESGKRHATLELLLPLSRQLGVGLDDLVRPAPTDPRVRRPPVRRGGLLMTPLTLEDAPVATYRITYPPAAEPPEPRTHAGYEWLYVLSGRLRLLLDDQDLVLEPGEAAEFDTRLPHAMCAAGPGEAAVLSTFDREGMRIHTRERAAGRQHR
ncbi:MAG: XRE family transcriptional regulator [Gordonia sp. (in: high G+C Gram-positive bacteria)]|uniref:helix-turn-helix domain-containing protein n=1 Tax=Gordonia sp. (in: high G+C Gram-positive bacteria) TaxID=84139 RepID=UPI0039E21E48